MNLTGTYQGCFGGTPCPLFFGITNSSLTKEQVMITPPPAKGISRRASPFKKQPGYAPGI